MSEFANISMNVNPSCAWVYADVQKIDDGEGTSSCEATNQISFCYTAYKACKRSEITREWIKTEFENHMISSNELVKMEDALEGISNYSLHSGLKVADLIATTPVDTIESWAMDNMPKMLRMVGDLANRVKALSIKESRYDLDEYGTASWTDFKNACESATPTCSDEMIEGDWCDTFLRCDANKIADGARDLSCLSAACLFDGGDCTVKSAHFGVKSCLIVPARINK